MKKIIQQETIVIWFLIYVHFFSPLPSFSGNKIRNEYGCYDNLLHMTIFSQAEVVCVFFLIFIVTQYFLKVMK